MSTLRDSLLASAAVAALAIGSLGAGIWIERSGATARDHENRLAALEQRLGLGLAQAQAARNAHAPEAPRAAEAPLPSEPVRVDVANAPALGPADAPVTLVAFSDFQCPFCARVVPTLEQLRSEYGDRVRVVFKHFPLPIHPQAMQAHQAALAAGEQGKFWEMHDRIFADQQSLGRESLIAHAKALGLNVAKFERALDSPELEKRIRADVEEGSRVGVRGTPTFVVNGRLFSGAQPYESFKAQIEQALAAKPAPRELAARTAP